ncbi:MAG: class I SAM-dependent methyltransferase [Halomonas sp.]|uniref:class I SAM-dependent methyltransferase n=1 Tax=Halomonas sp. TaxID=1486246 RepID=UPI002ACE6121|nr:class I SAM-dependent methyltransferase [Halomonas sp.]MDZ7854086.1 class I SAM-dependent methyltransferase [Halomonas sp.]
MRYGLTLTCGIKALRIEQGMKVVDLGCGDGYFTAAIARQVGAGRVIGLDLDPVMLEQAQAACEGMSNCSWLLGDAMALSRLLDASVDYVLIANTFHGVPDKTALAREVAKALKPNGRFAIVNWHPLPREQTTVLGQPRGPKTAMRMSVEQTRTVVEPAGFRLETLVELPPYHYGAVFIRAI